MFNLMIFAMCLTSARCLLKVPPPTQPTMLRRELEPRFPTEIHLRDLPGLRIPSSRFCKEQDLQPAQHYVLLPWWYHYCNELIDRRNKKYTGSVPNLELYKAVLDRVNAARKNMAAEVKQ